MKEVHRSSKTTQTAADIVNKRQVIKANRFMDHWGVARIKDKCPCAILHLFCFLHLIQGHQSLIAHSHNNVACTVTRLEFFLGIGFFFPTSSWKNDIHHGLVIGHHLDDFWTTFLSGEWRERFGAFGVSIFPIHSRFNGKLIEHNFFFADSPWLMTR